MQIKRAVALSFVLALCAAPVRAETTMCTAITSIPTVIHSPGAYCFTGNLVTNMITGTAIDIRSSFVVLDLNGFRLGGQAAGLATLTVGVRAQDVQNITIRNGTIRGFAKAVILDGGASRGHVVEDMHIDRNTHLGIWVEGTGSIVRNNRVLDTGAGTNTWVVETGFAAGITVGGKGHRVLNNDVIAVLPVAGGSANATYGISVHGDDGLAVNNRITSVGKGIVFWVSGKYRDNLTSDVTTPYTGGIDAGNNN